MRMTDGYNQARAMRVAQIMADFRNLMSYISRIEVDTPAGQADWAGFVVLRQCRTEAQALLAQPFDGPGEVNGDDEQQKTIFRRIITDAAVRRFKAQKLYTRSTAALRWVNGTAAVLQGQSPGPQHSSNLNRLTESLRSELRGITDQRIYQMLAMGDQDKWTAEDPDLATLTRLTAA